jgi:hypothetical protein
MTNPAHYTDPAWAAREARRQALEEAAALAEGCARMLDRPDEILSAYLIQAIAVDIRALAAKDPA